MNHKSQEFEQAEELVRRVLPTFDVSPSPDFRAQVLARAEALSASRRRGFTWGMPTWVQLWTPAVTMAALLVLTFTFWVNGPFAPERAPHRSEVGSPGTRGSTSSQETGQTAQELIQEGLRQEEMGHIPQAVEAYRAAVDQIALPLNQLAWLAYQQGKAAKGLEWARLAVQLQPEKAGYLDTLAVILCTIGEQDEAAQTMEKAAQLQPGKFGKKVERVRQGICQ